MNSWASLAPRCQHSFSCRRNPCARHFNGPVLIVEPLDPCDHQAALDELYKNLGRNVLGREESLGTAWVSSDELELDAGR